MIKKYGDIYIRIGHAIKDFRKKKNLTQVQLANLTAKLDDAKISDIENGKEDYMFSTLLQICEALDLNIELRQK